MQKIIPISSLLAAAILYSPAHATEDKRAKVMERVTVIGSQDRREEIPGAATIVDKKTLERFLYTDIHRALRAVPGVAVQEEDGFGLRPNITIRGGRANRSADITLMEDGVLAAPAPYASPDAYYFPQMDRMQSLEIIKSTGAIKYGPRTTNGVLNMITKPIPNDKQADFISEAGSYGAARVGMTTGVSTDNVGVLLNAVHKENNGFKNTDFVGGDTGFNVQDVLGKLRLNADKSAEHYQEVEFKLGNYDEISNETYLGLTDSDFAANPNRRYGSSQLDVMDVGAWQASARHFLEFSSSLDLTTTVYHNEVTRDWYKIESARIGGVTRDIATIFDNPIPNAAYIDTLRSANTAGGTFVVRANDRKFYGQGVQSVLAKHYTMGATKNFLEIGGRVHRDEADRYQRDDRFDMVGGRAVITSVGTPGGAGNHIQMAQAWSGFIQNELTWERWLFTPGLRYETIDLKRKDYGATDPTRSGSNLKVFKTNLDVWIPGASISYALTDSWKLLGGAHKGFSPPGVPANAAEEANSKPEESTNYEIGTRYHKGLWQAELFAYYKDYDNLVGRDHLSAGGAGVGDAFSAGKVEVRGLEASLGYDAASLFNLGNRTRLPLDVSYSYTEGQFLNNFVSGFAEWGTVNSGDALPYLPKNQLFLSAGVETDDWGFSLSGKFTDAMRTVAGRGPIPENRLAEAHWTFDIAGEHKITDTVKCFARIENLFDQTYVAARRPSGARPGMPMTALAGLKVALW